MPDRSASSASCSHKSGGATGRVRGRPAGTKRFFPPQLRRASLLYAALICPLWVESRHSLKQAERPRLPASGRSAFRLNTMQAAVRTPPTPQSCWTVGRKRISLIATSSGSLIAKATSRAKVSAGTRAVSLSASRARN